MTGGHKFLREGVDAAGGAFYKPHPFGPAGLWV